MVVSTINQSRINVDTIEMLSGTIKQQYISFSFSLTKVLYSISLLILVKIVRVRYNVGNDIYLFLTFNKSNLVITWAMIYTFSSPLTESVVLLILIKVT